MLKTHLVPAGILLFFAVLLVYCQANPYRDGERLYKLNCANCHMDAGEGLNALIPPLAGSDFLRNSRDQLPCLVRHGINDTIVVNGNTYAEQMPGVETLSDIQVVNILNYVISSWGNQLEPYRLDEVRQSLEKCRH